jgi:hypothetical protein
LKCLKAVGKHAESIALDFEANGRDLRKIEGKENKLSKCDPK